MVVPNTGTCYIVPVQIIAKRTLRVSWEDHPQARTPLQSWFATVSQSAWDSPADVKAEFGAMVDFVADNRVVFDISGNKYRLVVRVAYSHKRLLIKFVGTHADYDKIDARTV